MEDPNVTPRRRIERRWEALKSERSSWISHWRDIQGYLLPRSGRFLVTDRNKGWQRNNRIYDSTATQALRVLAAGMMSGMTSPARPWFRLATPDPDLMTAASVSRWLYAVQERMQDVMARSNFYRVLHSTYEELGAYGTASALLLEDFEEVIRGYPLTIGEYALAANGRWAIDTVYREFQLTIDQLVRTFGLDAVSTGTQNLYRRGSYDTWVTVLHGIEPRRERNPSKRDTRNMAWQSVYVERNASGDKLLSESGFIDFPAVAPRWSAMGGEIYGRGPGMESLGDIKQLQHEQLRKGQAIDKLSDPPMQGPGSLKTTPINTLPGGVTYADTAHQGGFKPLYEVQLDLNHLLADIREVQERIKSAFYVDMFLMLAQDDRSGVTAREVAERHEEKLLMLGPVLERLHSELLNPLVDRVFAIMVRADLIPPPPQELQGQPLKVEYVSTLAQAQRMVGLTSIDRLVGTIGSVAAIKPDIVDKLDADRMVDEYADLLGVPPELIVPGKQVATIRQQRAQQQAQQAMIEQAQQAAQGAKTLSETSTSGDNALANIARAVNQ